MTAFGNDSHADVHHGGDVIAAIACNDHGSHHSMYDSGFESTASTEPPPWQTVAVAAILVFLIVFVGVKWYLWAHRTDEEAITASQANVFAAASGTCEWRPYVGQFESPQPWRSCNEPVLGLDALDVRYTVTGVPIGTWTQLQDSGCHAWFANQQGDAISGSLQGSGIAERNAKSSGGKPPTVLRFQSTLQDLGNGSAKRRLQLKISCWEGPTDHLATRFWFVLR